LSKLVKKEVEVEVVTTIREMGIQSIIALDMGSLLLKLPRHGGGWSAECGEVG
jgi:hypothetical protein